MDIDNTILTRRNFVKTTTMIGVGLSIGIDFLGSGKLYASSEFTPNAFITVTTDNRIKVFIKHLDKGQGVYSGLASVVAEEMDADWNQIDPIFAPADMKKYGHTSWKVQTTGGSTSMSNSWQQLREAGATARAMLVNAAAKKWNTSPETLVVKNGIVSDPKSKREAKYGDLALEAAQLPIPKNVKLKSLKDFSISHKIKRKDSASKSNGSAIFGIDIKLPGMVTAVIARPPVFGGTLKKFDDKKTKAIAGVLGVYPLSSGIAVVGKDFWSAKLGRDALEIEWDEHSGEKRSTHEIMQSYKELAKKSGSEAAKIGDVEAGFKKAKKIIEAGYEFPYLAHAPMEPLNLVIKKTGQKYEVWSGDQGPSGTQFTLASILNTSPENIAVHVQFAGGSFGRRGDPHSLHMAEAGELLKVAKELDEKPIRIIWTREDDIKGGKYRPLFYHWIKAGIDDKGNIVAWKQRIVGQSILQGTPMGKNLGEKGIDPLSVEGSSNLAYEATNKLVELHTTQSKVPVLWWRSVGHTHNAYAVEAMIDELAVAAGIDPFQFRMNLLKKHPKHQAVLKKAAEAAQWGKKTLAKGKGMGIAVHESFNSFVAQVVEVTVTSEKQFKVDKVTCVIDCGFAVNPDIIKAQMEGCIGYALSHTLYGEISLTQGRVDQSNFHDYRSLRINEMPDIDVHIMQSENPPTGVGEPGVPPFAPALANAIANATKKRFYAQPFLKV